MKPLMEFKASDIPASSRKIMVFVPVMGVKPYRITLDYEVLDGKTARLKYEEQFLKEEKEIFAVTAQRGLAMVARALSGAGTFRPKASKQTNTVGFEAEGPAGILAGYALGEFLIQMFHDEDPSFEFWNIVDKLQHSFSTVHKDIWKEMPRQPYPLLVLCGKCAKPFNVSPTLNSDFVCPSCGYKGVMPKKEEKP